MTAFVLNAHKVPAKTFLPKRSHRNVPENKVPAKRLLAITPPFQNVPEKTLLQIRLLD
jgi:hypothetical protein